MQILRIINYSDYRTYLREDFERRKQQQSSWSLELWSRKLGIASKSTLAMILHGKRHPGPKLIPRLVAFYNFNESDAEYFCDLIQLQKSQHDTRLQLILMESLDKKRPASARRLLNDQEFKVIAKWYYYAIKEMIAWRNFRPDPAWIVKQLRFKVTPSQVQKALDEMLELKLIEKSPAGKLIWGQGHMTTTEDIASEAIKQFHEQVLDQAKETLRAVPVERRYFSGITFSIQEAQIDRAKELIKKFESEFIALLEDTQTADSTFQFNIQFYPITKAQKGVLYEQDNDGAAAQLQ